MAKKSAIRILTPETENIDHSFTHYVLVPIDAKGKDKGSEFSISKKGFAQTYKNRTAKPEGTAEKALFRVKKKK